MFILLLTYGMMVITVTVKYIEESFAALRVCKYTRDFLKFKGIKVQMFTIYRGADVQ